MRKLLFVSIVFVLILSACGSQEAGGMGMSPGSMMGGESDMMRSMHHGTVPEPYDGLVSPVSIDDEESIARGQEIYRVNCAECHGDGGMGDGQTGEQLNTKPAFIAHSSQMMNDGYLFWRVNEGGVEFGTGMPVFSEKLSEDEIWDVINYVRALGVGKASPVDSGMGGEMYDPEFERMQHESMLTNAIDEGLIEQAQADNFMLVHEVMNEYIIENDLRAGAQSVDEMQPEIFAALVESGTLTQEQADSFSEVHQLLLDEGLMR